MKYGVGVADPAAAGEDESIAICSVARRLDARANSLLCSSMIEHGSRCRPSRSRERREAEPFEVKLDGQQVRVVLRGRLVRTLVGNAAEEIRRALNDRDGEAIQRIVSRCVGRFERGEDR